MGYGWWTRFQILVLSLTSWVTVYSFPRDAIIKYRKLGTSLVIQGLRICLAMQGTWVPSLVREPSSHLPQSYWAYAAQLESVLHNERCHMTQPRSYVPPNNYCYWSVTQLYPTLCDPMDCSTPGSLSFTISLSFLKLMSIESVMPSNHLILCRLLLLLPSIFIKKYFCKIP